MRSYPWRAGIRERNLPRIGRFPRVQYKFASTAHPCSLLNMTVARKRALLRDAPDRGIPRPRSLPSTSYTPDSFIGGGTRRRTRNASNDGNSVESVVASAATRAEARYTSCRCTNGSYPPSGSGKSALARSKPARLVVRRNCSSRVPRRKLALTSTKRSSTRSYQRPSPLGIKHPTNQD
ncbi:hypothetical protein ARMSODRAFT_327087 [Armillaria solidipes]|uniref:Uncharacterized protein n=1 Tax=Armillaria solidipes TaxID=1076256 RepID=A0A2H3B8T2_9AGAR|nr:hypothetical protein ARMSODRAFT_327087 [Armillaria solidipes]